jgi:hypothetical protein
MGKNDRLASPSVCRNGLTPLTTTQHLFMPERLEQVSTNG